MDPGLSLVTPDWFISHAAIGIAVGYFLRVFEHVVWSGGEEPANARKLCRWALMMMPQSVLSGAALGYLILAVFAFFVKNGAAIELAAYLVTALMAFYADELRGLLRRISRF